MVQGGWPTIAAATALVALSLFTVRVRGETVALGYELARCEMRCVAASERAATLSVGAAALVPELARAQGRLQLRVADRRAEFLAPDARGGVARGTP